MNIMTKLNIRQKIMLALTVLAAAFLVWQIYNFVHGNTAPQQSLASLPSVPASAGGSTAAGVAIHPVAQPLPATPKSPVLTRSQQEYLGLVREYQVTKMRRQILDEQAGLASAQKRVADAGRSGADLMSIGTFGDTAGNGDDLFTNSGANYQLVYLDRQAGQWTATLSQNGQYKEAHVGTHLRDGAKVIGISSRGVVLRSAKGKNIVLSFQGSVNVDEGAATISEVKALPAAQKQATASVEPGSSNTVTRSNHAKIPKILGIPAAPTTIAPTQSTTDIPAAPMTVAPSPSQPETQQLNTPDQPSTTANDTQPPTPSQQTAPSTPDAASTPAIKPMSVQELRGQDTEDTTKIPAPVALESDSTQISWRQAADLQAAVLSPSP